MSRSPTNQDPTHRTMARVTPFTLVELLAAMAVLVIVMGFMFNFLSNAQRTWSMMETNTRVYENARAALGLITRDLQGAIASDTDSREIPFFVGKTSPAASDSLLAFVTAQEPESSARTRLCEIHYCQQSYRLTRAAAFDRNSSGEDSDWDFFGDLHDDDSSPGNSVPDWVDSRANRHVVIRGVENITFTCYHPGGTLTGGGNGTGYTYLPAAVQVSMTLFDEKLHGVWAALDANLKNRSRRTFTKTIFLRGRD